MDKWPRHADGSPKKMGEMTREERFDCTKQSVARLKAEFENPAHQRAMEDALSQTIQRMRR